MSPPTQILLLGAGELGTAFLPPLSTLPNTHLTLGTRHPTKYTHLTTRTISLTTLDLSGPSPALSRTFAAYDIVISATGFAQSPATLTKLAGEVLDAGKLRAQAGKSKLWFFPWQWGVDYDVTGDGRGLMPLFGAQVTVRNILRSEAAACNVRWTVVSTGVFMSFLFEQFWGVVDRRGDRITVRALREWGHRVSVTDVADIGTMLARIVKGDVQAEDRVVYVAGDTVSYGELAGIVERVTGEEVRREEWTVAHLEAELKKDPEDLIKKYRLVFARDGVAWDKERTVNHELGVSLMNVETYARALLGKRL